MAPVRIERRDVSTRSDGRPPEIFRTASRVVVKTSFEVALVDAATGAWCYYEIEE